MTQFMNRSFVAVLTSTLFLSMPALAIDSQVLQLINEGNSFIAAGDNDSASISFVNAKGRAADMHDWDGMLSLSDRFFTIASEWHGKDCFLLASQYAHAIADSASTSGDPEATCGEAVNALNRVAMAWETGIIDIAMSEETQTQMQGMSDIASQNADWYEENGCP